MKNSKRCRTKFGMKEKLAALVLGAALMAFPFASCNTSTSGGGDEPNDKPTTYSVTVSSSIEHGKVSASPTTATAGDTITLTVTPSTGYKLDTLTVKDAGSGDVTTTKVTEGESYTFTMPESNVTVTVTFRELRPEVSGKLGKYASPYEVGDIVFKDGSATPYTTDLTLDDNEKAAAIAIIFYKGTEINSGDDTATRRTLGVGLKHHRSGLAWCLSSAAADSKNITTIQSDDKNGSDNLKQIGDFLAGNSSTDDTGTAGNYPAFYFAKNYASQDGSRVSDTSYADDWYLPSIAELDQIYKNKGKVDAASALCGGDKFGSSLYWSSSQSASNDSSAYVLYFYDGDWCTFYKFDTSSYECAVRAFN